MKNDPSISHWKKLLLSNDEKHKRNVALTQPRPKKPPPPKNVILSTEAESILLPSSTSTEKRSSMHCARPGIKNLYNAMKITNKVEEFARACSAMEI